MSDEEGGKKESKKYKELSKDRPSISFSLGRAKLKRHSEFTTNKNKKMTTSSPEVRIIFTINYISERMFSLPKSYDHNKHPKRPFSPREFTNFTRKLSNFGTSFKLKISKIILGSNQLKKFQILSIFIFLFIAG